MHCLLPKSSVNALREVLLFRGREARVEDKGGVSRVSVDKGRLSDTKSLTELLIAGGSYLISREAESDNGLINAAIVVAGSFITIATAD